MINRVLIKIDLQRNSNRLNKLGQFCSFKKYFILSLTNLEFCIEDADFHLLLLLSGGK